MDYLSRRDCLEPLAGTLRFFISHPALQEHAPSGHLVAEPQRRDQLPAIPVGIRNAAGPARANRRPGSACDEFPRNATNRTPAEPPGSFASRKYPRIPENPFNIKPQRILSITGKKSITRGIVPMTTTSARSAQPSDKPAYVPPRVMRLGDLNEGAGACAAGSGVTAGACNPAGANATTDCNSGNVAGDSCIITGSTASVGVCSTGSSAPTSSCDSNGVTAGTACNAVGNTP